MNSRSAICSDRDDPFVGFWFTIRVQLGFRRQAGMREDQLTGVFEVLAGDDNLNLEPTLPPIGIVVKSRGNGRQTVCAEADRPLSSKALTIARLRIP